LARKHALACTQLIIVEISTVMKYMCHCSPKFSFGTCFMWDRVNKILINLRILGRAFSICCQVTGWKTCNCLISCRS